ncbi:neuromedin-S isoform X1 [Cervus elaphus]|uniref:neuromedin-S isoform X1 n=1 Tax=Cervus elaphus TaxID=9860 RepID=UPI001CC3197A|nr:neuromedin-S isoform X1 [Cervus elaphus]
MLSSYPGRTHLWPAKRIWTLKMKCLAQFPSILAIYCFCLLQIPSSGFPRPLADASDGLDIVKFERMAYWASLSRQPKDSQDIYKRFLFHYSRTQEPTHPVKTGFPPVHPLMRLAAKLADRRMKTFWRRVCTFSIHHTVNAAKSSLLRGFQGHCSGFYQKGLHCHLGKTVFPFQAKEWKKP